MTDDRLTRQQYRKKIEMLADSVIEGVKEYDQEPPEAVFETVDGSELVFKTHLFTDVLSYSEPEEWSHLVADDETDYRTVLQAMAFSAVRSDVWDELHNRDADLESLRDE